MTLHDILDVQYGADGDATLRRMLKDGHDVHGRDGPMAETPLHVATRRRRVSAVALLLDHGADIDARTAGGKTAYAHAVRRGFDDVAALLRARGASTALNDADRLAVAVVQARFDEARAILQACPGVARTGNQEEDRLLADVAGRDDARPVELLIAAGADLAAPGLDFGTPLHQASWFGQPDNARLLVVAGAPLNVIDPTHGGSPLGWAAHGSRYSGDAELRQEAYVGVVRLLLAAGAALEPLDLLMEDATPAVRSLLQAAAEKHTRSGRQLPPLA